MTFRRCVIVGGGPAGFALAVNLLRGGSGLDVEVYDAPAAGGVGIVLDSEFVEALAVRDPISAEQIRSVAQIWDTVRLQVGDHELITGGHVILGIERQRLLDVLRGRACNLGAKVHTRPWDPSMRLGREDLLVGADGAGSRVRQAREAEHATTLSDGLTQYLWMRTDAALTPGFWFRRTPHGAFVAHVYPYGPKHSAVVVEATSRTLRAAGLNRLDRRVAETQLTALFADQLHGVRLQCSTFPWRSFRTVANRRWHTGRQVLIGDAAHTTHFSVGSGTRLAIEDADALAESLDDTPSVAALKRYESVRRPAIEAMQTDADSSRQWFEDIDRHIRLPAHQLAFALRTRRDVNTWRWLRRRDPAFTAKVLASVRTDPRAAPAPRPDHDAPRLQPLRIGHLTMPTRLAVIRPDGPHPPGTTPAGLVLYSSRATTSGAGPLPIGHIVPPTEAEPSSTPCVLLTGSWPVLRQRLANRSPQAGQAVGVMIDCVGWRSEDAVLVRATADFVVVPMGHHGQRVERTALAERIRNVHAMTVLLWATDLSEDDADTLIGAGRIDGYLLHSPNWEGVNHA
ncbi:FAD-dependent monooxygenase [Streptomyces uncialis]|uniref:FAD-dependent monooxygenase n=1 Tax=Streptomyces uncialis TaxID=1048205 RepID=UPI002E2EB926|nr:FAD-dependent monooxygenase [Streptomyces uncialis]